MFKRLLKIRSRRAIALWIVVLLALPLILFFHFGAGDESRPGPGGTAGVVFGRTIPWERYQQEYQLVRRALESHVEGSPEGLESIFQQQTWDRLILVEEARRRMRVSDAAVARSLRAQPAFQQDGRFVPGLYYRFVRAIGSTPRAFEERLRDDLRVQKLLDQVTPEEQTAWMASLRQRARLKSFLSEPAATPELAAPRPE